MKTEKLSNTFLVECPHCNEQAEVTPHDVGDEFMCSWSHCNEDFIVPENKPIEFLKVTG